MDKEIFRTIISENQEYIGSIPLVERPLDLEEYGNYVFVGVRQALNGEMVAPVSRRMTARIRVTKAAAPATSANTAP